MNQNFPSGFEKKKKKLLTFDKAFCMHFYLKRKNGDPILSHFVLKQKIHTSI
jgi:hypothetical protein